MKDNVYSRVTWSLKAPHPRNGACVERATAPMFILSGPQPFSCVSWSIGLVCVLRSLWISEFSHRKKCVHVSDLMWVAQTPQNALDALNAAVGVASRAFAYELILDLNKLHLNRPHYCFLTVHHPQGFHTIIWSPGIPCEVDFNTSYTDSKTCVKSCRSVRGLSLNLYLTDCLPSLPVNHQNRPVLNPPGWVYRSTLYT